MTVNLDVEKINAALNNFSNALGIGVALFDPDFAPISSGENKKYDYCGLIQSTEKGKRACIDSDLRLLKKCGQSHKTEARICHAGLISVASPIIYDETIIGYLVFGKMRTKSDFASNSDYIAKLGLSIDSAHGFYNNVPFFDNERIESVSNIAVMLVKYILLENMLRPDFSESTQRVVNYINQNLNAELSIKEISKNCNVSKSVIYKNFRKAFNMTVSEYINSKRIEKSLDLLLKTEYSIEEISQKVGFLSTSYFSRTFKKQMGISPLKYRKK